MAEPKATGPSGTSTPASGPPTKKTQTWMYVVGGLFAFCVVCGVGTAMGYAGTLLGILGAGGLVVAGIKGKPERRKLFFAGAGACVLLALFGLFGAQARAKKAADEVAAVEAAKQREAAAAEATKKKVESDNAARAALVSQLATDPASAPSEVTALCAKIAALGPLPPEHEGRCSDALKRAEEQQRNEKQRLEILAAPEHLKAAKAALAKDYDAKTRVGGDLDEAERQLAAIEPSAPEAKEAKALVAEVVARKKRAAQKEEDDRKKDGQRAESDRLKAIKAKRASRQYLKMSPDQLANAMENGSDVEEKLDTQWKEKWVRWPTKFRVRSLGMGIIFNAGNSFEMACDSIDEDEDNAKFDALKAWQATTIEARFTGLAKLQKALDGNRVVLNFDDCSIAK